MRNYDYDGFFPYGAGELFSLDMYVDHDFSGNVVEQIISDGLGVFEIVNSSAAFLRIRDARILFVR